MAGASLAAATLSTTGLLLRALLVKKRAAVCSSALLSAGPPGMPANSATSSDASCVVSWACISSVAPGCQPLCVGVCYYHTFCYLVVRSACNYVYMYSNVNK